MNESLPALHENTVTVTNELMSKSESSSDRIGDLGDLSDFSDTVTSDMAWTERENINLKNDIEIDHFVDITDKTEPNQFDKLHILSKSNEGVSVDISDMYIDIDVSAQHSIFNILCNGNGKDLSSLVRSESKSKSMDTNDIESSESNQY